jgi:hypothetical protein
MHWAYLPEFPAPVGIPTLKEAPVGISVPSLVIACVAVLGATILATIAGGVAVVLGRMDGTSWPSALSRGSLAFAGTMTVTLAVLAFASTCVQ